MDPIIILFLAAFLGLGGLFMAQGKLIGAMGFWVPAAIAAQSLKMAKTWQKSVVPRTGKLQYARDYFVATDDIHPAPALPSAKRHEP